MTLRSAILALALLSAATAAPAAAQTPDVVMPADGAQYQSSDNVELIGQIKTVGDGVGAAIHGKYMYVTSTKSLSIFDLTDPEKPKPVGTSMMQVEWENEEVPTNGKILGISSTIGCPDPASNNAASGTAPGTNATGCLSLYDVSNPATPKLLSTVGGAGEHTSACLYDCTWFYGSRGAITDARDPANAKLAGKWTDAFPDGTLSGSCHHIREVRPGYVLGSCIPLILMSLRAEDGGSVTKPVIIATGDTARQVLIHSSRWPREGRDRWLLAGEETNAQPQCTDTVAAFMTFDATNALDPMRNFITGAKMKITDEVRPTQGTYTDGAVPANALGCSVHWFMEHPAFNDGGIVAVAEYENGTRLFQVRPDGKLVEQGFYLPAGGSASAPHWHPNGKIFYAIDYTRGIDILRYTGDTYVPLAGATPPLPGATPGSGGTTTPAPCASAAGFDTVSANPTATGLRIQGVRRAEAPFDVQIFQHSAGRRVYDDPVLRARFDDVTGVLDWDGKDSKGRDAGDGTYSIRLTMTLADGTKDVRTLALDVEDGEFDDLQPFRSDVNCGAVKAFTLSGPAFGGRTKEGLAVSYTLSKAVKDATLEARVGRKVVERFKAGRRAGRRHRFKLKAGEAKRGKTVRVRLVVEDEDGKITRDDLFAVRV